MIAHWLRDELARRPWWMNGLMFFCAFMAFVYMPIDLFLKPLATDEEVWFGIRFYGWTAKLLALPHWAVYAAGLYGFWTLARWMHPWAALYTAQFAIGMLVWALCDPRAAGRGLAFGVPPFLAFGALAWLLWRSHTHFNTRAG